MRSCFAKNFLTRKSFWKNELDVRNLETNKADQEGSS